MGQPDRADDLLAVCNALARNGAEEAAALLRLAYPFVSVPPIKRVYGPVQSTQTFIRDGFIDRYSGQRLVFPPVLRLLSAALPNEFPFHPNWKTEVTHSAYWELTPTIDHVVPVSKGGADDESNWVTTSMARNCAKLNSTLAEIGWTLHPPGSLSDWDGLLQWYLEYSAVHPEAVSSGWQRRWRQAALRFRTGI